MNEARPRGVCSFFVGVSAGTVSWGRRIVIDCANGAASPVAPQLFAGLEVRSSSLMRVLTERTSMKTAEHYILKLLRPK